MLPRTGALLGVDFGTRRIGIAICNPEQTIAMPLETLHRSVPARELARWKELATDYRIVGLVCGLPLHAQSGDESKMSALARSYMSWLAAELRLTVDFQDERHSSSEAELHFWATGRSPQKNKAKLDPVAARVILQSYLDQPRASGTNEEISPQ